MVKNINKVTLINYSSTITTGGTAQTAIAANESRKFLLVQNPPGEIEDLIVSLTTAAAANDETMLTLEPGAAIMFDDLVPVTRVSVIAATTGHNFIAYEG